MFLLRATKNELTLCQSELLTSGSVGVYQVRFAFNSAWDGLTKAASFRAGSTVVSVLLDDTGACVIPWEVLSLENVKRELSIGVYGTLGGEVVLPTIWKNVGTIQQGAALGPDAAASTPSLIEQALQQVSEEREKAETAADRAEAAADRAESAGTGTGGTAGTGNVSSDEIRTIKVLDLAEYEALEAKDGATLYLIRG